MRKYSKQKEAIIEYLTDRTDHPCAEQIFLAVKESQPSISRGTVYRNLAILSEDGDISKFECEDGAVHYDPRTDSHAHFFCRHCKKIYDIEMEAATQFEELLANELPGRLESVNIIISGICKACDK